MPRGAATVALSLATGLLLAGACGPREADAPPARRGPADGLRFETRALSRRAGDCERPSGACATIQFEYPVVTGGASSQAAKEIERFVQASLLVDPIGDTAPATIEEYADQYLAAYERSAPGAADPPARWKLERRIGVLYRDDRVVSLEVRESQSRGGDSTLITRRLASFDPESGAEWTVADIFADDTSRSLIGLAERRFREARQIPEGQELAAAGFSFPGNRFALPENEAIVGDGLLLRYNPFEVAAIELGPTEFTLTCADLREIVNADGPLARCL